MKASIASSAQCRSSTTSTRRASRGEALEELAPGREVLLARGFLCLEAEERAQAGAQTVAVLAVGQHGLEARLAARHAVALEDAGDEPRRSRESAQKVTPEPKGRQRPWRQVTTVGLVVEAAGELGQQAALADAGLADDEGEARRCVRRPASSSSCSEASSSSRPTKLEEKRAQLRAGARQGGGRDPGLQRLALALERDGGGRRRRRRPSRWRRGSPRRRRRPSAGRRSAGGRRR